MTPRIFIYSLFLFITFDLQIYKRWSSEGTEYARNELRPVVLQRKDYDDSSLSIVANCLFLVFSVFRSGKLDATELQFTILKDKLPLLLQCVPDLCTRDLIQEVVSLCRSNPSWSLAHIAAHMGMLDVLKHASVKRYVVIVCYCRVASLISVI